MATMEAIGRYRVLSLLGGGGMATVYKAEHPVLKQPVAVKVLHSYLAVDPDFVARFQREAEAVARLRHPNIVRWLDFDTDGDTCFMVLEFIDGPALDARLRELAVQGRRLTSGEVLALMRPLAAALDYAHAQGFVHRDLKPANILLTAAGEPVITDFGIARFLDQSGLTQTGTVMGSAHYMSPEQIEARPTDGRSDLYSLGIILFQLLAGRVPYDGENTAVILAKHLAEPVPSLFALDHSMPQQVDAVLGRVLAKDRDVRHGSGAELVRELEEALSALAVIVPGQASPPVDRVAPPVIPPLPAPVPAPPTRREEPRAPAPFRQSGSVPGGVPALPSARRSPASPTSSAPSTGTRQDQSTGVGARFRGLVGSIVVVAALIIAAGIVGVVIALASGGDPGGVTERTAPSGSLATSMSAVVTTTVSVGTYALGDAGPAGGLTFYDKGDSTGGWRYLEAAPADTEWHDVQWGERSVFISNADGAAVGTGKGNTAAIVAAQGPGNTYAAQLCDGLTVGGYSDWFLPSYDELNVMYENLKVEGLGGLQPGLYWSSSQHTADTARGQYFASGYRDWSSKGNTFRVRAVRAF